MTCHMFTVVVELAELFELIYFRLVVKIAAVRDDMDVIVTRLVKHKLSLRNQRIWAFIVI